MTMRRYSVIFIGGILGLGLLWGAGVLKPSSKATEPRRPNILVIVADDLGFSDLGAFGSEIATPNLDGLARDGLRLSSFYASPTCSPTRAMFFSGTDNHLAGLGNMAGVRTPNQMGKPGYEGYLNTRVSSIAELMRAQGYRTILSGKWHLGNQPDQDPSARGFAQSFVLVPGGHNHFGQGLIAPKGLSDPLYRENGQVVETLPANFYSSDSFTDKLLEFLAAGNEKQPFFAYLAYTAPHWPLQAPPEDIAKYHGKYDAGYEVLQKERFAALQKEGFIPADLAFTPRQTTAEAWDKLSAEEKAVEARKMEIYAAMIDRMDRNVGRVIDYLKQTGELDNTIIVFFSDNGAEGDRVEEGPLWRDFVAQSFDPSFAAMGTAKSFVTTGPGWAAASTAPYRLFKRFTTEGGIRVPAFIRYPGFAEQGAVSDAMMTVMDLAPTFATIAGATFPGEPGPAADKLPYRGKSLLPYLLGGAAEAHAGDEIFGWEMFGHRAVHQGDWKAVNIAAPEGSGAWELFNLATDPGERHDLSAAEPERLRQMLEFWDSYAAETGVVMPDRPVVTH